MNRLPPEIAQFEGLAEAALEVWDPGASIILLKPLSGFSGAAVYKADISGGKSLQPGQYIIKLLAVSDWGEAAEHSRHEQVTASNTDFAKQHIPALVRHFVRAPTDPKEQRLAALLYNVAGQSLDRLVTIYSPGLDLSGLTAVCRAAFNEILAAWRTGEVSYSDYHRALLREWLGYRLLPDEGQSLRDFVSEMMGMEPLVLKGAELLINPLWFAVDCSISEKETEIGIRGTVHGDLHGGNILVPKLKPAGIESYWLIDFALAKDAPIAYDHAYFELAHLVKRFAKIGPQQLFSVLRALHELGKPVIPENAGTVELLRAISESFFEWQQKVEPLRLDPLTRQYMLARVAVGLNWANKQRLEKGTRELALLSAGWWAMRYLETYHPQYLEDSKLRVGAPAEPVRLLSAPTEETWGEAWDALGRFVKDDGYYILIVDALPKLSENTSLGVLPWSLVIDFDPNSEEQGLLESAGPVLGRHRSLHVVGLESIEVPDFRRGTGWMMAAGWPTRDQPAPVDERSWRLKYLSHLRQLLQKAYSSLSPAKVRFLFLINDDSDQERRKAYIRLAQEVEEIFQGTAEIVEIGNERALPAETAKHFPLSNGDFVRGVFDLYGAVSYQEQPHIPSLDGRWVQVDLNELRFIEESLDVLHSRVLESTQSTSESTDQAPFWRGHAPRWGDLHANLDVARSLYGSVTQSLQDVLSENRNYTIELHHGPGSGGTTLSLRVAWDLRNVFPVAVLRNYIQKGGTAERLERLFHLAQRPVLLVADARELSDASREDLYRQMAQRNCRVVLLYVRRTLAPRGTHQLELLDPMDPEEANSFSKVYSDLTTEVLRKAEIQRITTSPELARYRSAFFYGLITFEEEFRKIDEYVKAHLENAEERLKVVMSYIALLTRFTKTGMHEEIARALLGNLRTKPLSIAELFGDGPARLLIQTGGRLRIMHPLLAEEVLAERDRELGKDWRLGLAELAMAFIDDLSKCVDTATKEVRDLLRQLFLHRETHRVPEEVFVQPQNFAEVIDEIDRVDPVMGQRVFEKLTDIAADESHFWNHRGRHHVYRLQHSHDTAEKHLLEAIRLDEKDSVHHVVRGIILRSWIRHETLDVKGKTPEELMQRVQHLITNAASAFLKARQINTESEYGYIPNIQMNIWVVRRLEQAADASNVAELTTRHPALADSVRQLITEAESLLDQVSRLYRSIAGSVYTRRCKAGLKRLYGDLDAVIALWESAKTESPLNPIERRSLAEAYHARRERDWAKLPDDELSRISELMEANFDSGYAIEDDYRLWFQANKRLEKFDAHEALQRLRIWAERFESAQAYYYIYVLNFLLWFKGEAQALEACREALEFANRLATGKRTRSYEWLGVRPPMCPLVLESQLGGWNLEKRFWNNEAPLRRINGWVGRLKGQQAGEILIDAKMSCFFVPGDQFWRTNDKVTFYLGFSPAGLRAWRPEKGWIEGGSKGEIPVKDVETKVALPVEERPLEDRDSIGSQRIRGTVQYYDRNQRQGWISAEGKQKYSFSARSVQQQELHFLWRAAMVEFTPTISHAVSIAEKIRVLQGAPPFDHDPVAEAQLRVSVLLFVLERVRSSQGGRISLQDLGKAIKDRFGTHIYEQLRHPTLYALLKLDKEVEIEGIQPKLFAREKV